MIIALVIGTAFGFLGAIPVAGPISALALKYGLKYQYRKAQLLAAGSGLAEAIYVLLGFMGYSLFVQSIPHFERISNLLAGTILIGLGLYFLFTKSSKWVADPPPKHLKEGGKHAFLIGYGIAIMNPALIATWTTVISTLHGLNAFPYTTLNAVAFSLGVWLGIVLWFSFMLQLMKKNRHRFETRWIKRILLTMGVLLVGLGIATLLNAKSA
jgi:threonine/homoserine/homoserine lactone efflux protein